MTAPPEARIAAVQAVIPAAREMPPIAREAIDRELRQEILGYLPRLRAFAISLTGDLDRADDLVQETLVRALGNLHRFEPGTTLLAWLFTILRNNFHTAHRKRRREVEDVDGSAAANLSVAPDQHAKLDLDDLRNALARLPAHQREAILLVGAQGLSYEAAARICDTAVGTIKSRVNRARAQLAELLDVRAAEDLGPDRVIRAAIEP